ncbi:MAG: hypothetical protein AB8U25_01990 [Rickettsiales endosymbiont of Dermacentor nuttalli]
MSKDSNNHPTSSTGITATTVSAQELEEETRRKNQQYIVHIGGKNPENIAHITSNPSTDKDTNQKKQYETNGGGAILGAVTGVGLGIAAGLAMGPLAPIAVPALAIAGYFAGMYTGDTIEASIRGFSEGTFTDRIKGFMQERLQRIDRTIGGCIGLAVGTALSFTLGPVAPMALPFLAFYGNRIGIELGEMTAPTLINAFKKALELIKDFKELFSSKKDPKQNDLSQKTTPSHKQQSNDITAISSNDLKQAEYITKSTKLSDQTSKIPLPNTQQKQNERGR